MEKAFTLQEQRLDGKTNRSVITIGFLLYCMVFYCVVFYYLFIRYYVRCSCKHQGYSNEQNTVLDLMDLSSQ